MSAVTKLQPGPKDLYEIGEIPPLGHVPSKMYAWAIRRERHGPRKKALQLVRRHLFNEAGNPLLSRAEHGQK